MISKRIYIILVGLLVAMPAMAADTFQIVINSDSPAVIPTGLIMAEDDRILVRAEGAIRLQSGLPFSNGWFSPSGLGRVQLAGQLLPEAPLGLLMGSYTSSFANPITLGDMALVRPPSSYAGNEFQLALNIPPGEMSSINGAFVVHLTRFREIEALDYTYTLDAEDPRPKGTGLIANGGDQFLVIGQGAARTVGVQPVTRGWFDAAGLGALSRVGEIKPNMPYGSLLGTFTGATEDGFYLGDWASWNVQAGDIGNELMLDLNMSDDDWAILQGQIVAHVLRIGDGSISSVDGDVVPGRRTIVSVENFPNPFNPQTTVRFELTRPKEVQVSVVNVAGEVVQTLASQSYPAGTHSLVWDGRNGRGRAQASGTYFLRLETDEGMETHKLALIK